MGNHAHVQFFSGPDKDHLALNGELVFTLEEWARFGFALFNGARRHAVDLDYSVDIDDSEVWTRTCDTLLRTGEVSIPYALPG